MKRILLATTACGLVATGAMAGGIDRAQPPYSILFEDGNYVQLSFQQTRASVSGDYPAAIGGGGTDNMANVEQQFGFALKTQLNEQLAFAFLMGQPYGANSSYTEGAYGPIAGLSNTGLEARWQSTDMQAILKYNITNRFSVYGGLRALRSSANIAIPTQLGNQSSQQDELVDAQTNGFTGTAKTPFGDFPAPVPAGSLPTTGTIVGDYTADGSQETDLGYVLGAAYEIPDIAARVAFTYRSEIEHEFDVDESYNRFDFATLQSNVLDPAAALSAVERDTKLKVRMPQSLTIDFQTGVAQDTLLFGSARWTNWSVWEVETEAYAEETGGNIVSFDNDTWTYSLGLGRRINDQFSVFASLGHETKKGGEASRLAPTDGYTSIGLGGSYQFDNMKVTAGVQHAWLGDAEDGSEVEFTDNTATGFGFSLGFNF